jgi:hypothetical protein
MDKPATDRRAGGPGPGKPASPQGGDAALPHLWGAAEVRARLEEAARTLRALGLGARDRPARLASRWPEVVRESMEAYGYAAPRLRLGPPTPAAISRADEAVAWLLWVEDAERRIVWARACRIPWRRLEDLDGRSHTTLRKVEAGGLAAIRRRLNAAPGEAAAFGRGGAGAGAKDSD